MTTTRIGERARYMLPFDVYPDKIDCWHIPGLGPVLDKDDVSRLNWTTGGINFDSETNHLRLCHPTRLGTTVTIEPIEFTVMGESPDVIHIGWPFVNYVDFDPWVLITKHREQIAPPVTGPISLSGSLTICFDTNTIDAFFAKESTDQVVVSMNRGNVTVTKGISTDRLITIAANMARDRFPNIAIDRDDSMVYCSDGEIFVCFNYDFTVRPDFSLAESGAPRLELAQ